MDEEDLSAYYSGNDSTAPAVGVPGGVGGYLPGDYADAAQMEPFTPAPAREQGAPWWAGAALYGVTKAIDNQFPGSPTGVMGNTFPGSGASWDGRTYTFNTGSGGVRTVRPGQVGGSAQVAVRGNPMLLLLIGGAALYVLTK